MTWVAWLIASLCAAGWLWCWLALTEARVRFVQLLEQRDRWGRNWQRAERRAAAAEHVTVEERQKGASYRFIIGMN